MENFFSRYRKETVLVALLFAQMIALATQVKVRVKNVDPMFGPVATQEGGTRLIRVWAVAMVSPFQRAAVNTGVTFRGLWHSYVDLRGIRHDNELLQQEVNRLRLEQVRMQEDAQQGRRLQALLGFKEQFASKTLAAEVIGTSGSEMSRVVYVDRGRHDGIEPGMAVITPDGIVGKVTRADRNISQVLLINDPTSGAGVMLDRLRLNGILKGAAGGYPEILYVMADEKIEVGDRVLTTGGDKVFPKGLFVGTVESVVPDRERDPFLAIKVKPAVNLSRLEEVLIITQVVERTPEVNEGTSGPMRAADMLAQRLPSARKKELDAAAAAKAAGAPAAPLKPKEGLNGPPSTSATNASTEKPKTPKIKLVAPKQIPPPKTDETIPQETPR
jgi:rod shape-determining protein MreC